MYRARARTGLKALGSTSADSEFGAADSCKVNYNFLPRL